VPLPPARRRAEGRRHPGRTPPADRGLPCGDRDAGGDEPGQDRRNAYFGGIGAGPPGTSFPAVFSVSWLFLQTPTVPAPPMPVPFVMSSWFEMLAKAPLSTLT